jgi:hypothetical protein
MAWLYVHPAGPLMLRYKGGAWAAELKGRKLGRWSRPEDAALALHASTTGDQAWDTRLDASLAPAEIEAWRRTLDAWEDPPPRIVTARQHRRPSQESAR